MPEAQVNRKSGRAATRRKPTTNQVQPKQQCEESARSDQQTAVKGVGADDDRLSSEESCNNNNGCSDVTDTTMSEQEQKISNTASPINTDDTKPLESETPVSGQSSGEDQKSTTAKSLTSSPTTSPQDKSDSHLAANSSTASNEDNLDPCNLVEPIPTKAEGISDSDEPSVSITSDSRADQGSEHLPPTSPLNATAGSPLLKTGVSEDSLADVVKATEEVSDEVPTDDRDGDNINEQKPDDEQELVVEIASSPIVVIEPESPAEAVAADLSTSKTDDQDDAMDSCDADSSSGLLSPAAADEESIMSFPVGAEFNRGVESGTASGDVRPARLIEVVCGATRAQLDVELLVTGLQKASNSTTSRAACVLVSTTTAASTGSGRASLPTVLTMTPNQFQKFSGRGTARDWKRSIRHHGISLKALMAKNILSLTPGDTLGCRCNRCTNAVSSSSAVTMTIDPANVGDDILDLRSTIASAAEAAAVPPASTLQLSPTSSNGDQENRPPLRRTVDNTDRPRTGSGLTSVVQSLSTGGGSIKVETPWRLPAFAGPRKRASTTGNDDGASQPPQPKRMKSMLIGRQVDPNATTSGLQSRSTTDGVNQAASLTTADVWCGKSLIKIDSSVLKSASAEKIQSAAGCNTPSTVFTSGKEATMASIIRELRTYKNHLSEKIDASRRQLSTSSSSSPELTFQTPEAATAISNASITVSSPSQAVGRTSGVVNLEIAGKLSSATRRSSVGGQSVASVVHAPQFVTDSHGALDLSNSSPAIQPPSNERPGQIALKSAVNVDPFGVLDLSVGGKSELTCSASPASNAVTSPSSAGSQNVWNRGNWPSTSLFSAANLQLMLSWTVDDVVKFAAGVPGCSVYSETFRRFEVDGTSLAMLSVDQMTGILAMRRDSAQALRFAIDCAITSPSPALTSSAQTSSPSLLRCPSANGGSPFLGLPVTFGGISPVHNAQQVPSYIASR